MNAATSATKTTALAAERDDAATSQRPAQPKRINVAVTPEVVQALELVMEREQVSLTEAARRLMSYGDFIYRAVKEEGAELLLRTDDSTREVVLL